MDANGRKAFWDALLNVKLDNPQSIEALRQAATPPRLLCRFRPVSEKSLLQLQENNYTILLPTTTMTRLIRTSILI